MSDESRRIRNSMERLDRAVRWCLDQGIDDVADVSSEGAARARGMVESLLEQLREESKIVSAQLDQITKREQLRVDALQSVWAAIAGGQWPDR